MPAGTSMKRAGLRASPLSPLVSRPRLIQELKRVLDLRAFFITAEAGYGKTTILLQALSQLDAIGVLVPLREAHRDDAAFLCASVIEGLRGLRAGFGAYTMAAMRAGLDASKLAHALAADLAALQEPLVVAFDDAQYLIDDRPRPSTENEGGEDWTQQPAMAGMTLIAELLRNEGPSDVHFLVASRRLLPLRYSRMALQGLSTGLGSKDLAFTTDEVRTYLERVAGRPISLTEARDLEATTEGWPAGLALSQIDVPHRREPKPLRRHRQALDYLEQEVMPSLPDRLRDFVVGAASLTDLAPDLCDYALDRTDSFECLQELERRNLFIQRLPGKDRLFRLHAIFRELLRERYLEPVRQRAVQLKAAQFWTVNQRWLEVVTYLRDAGAWDDLQTLLLNHGRSLVDQGYASTVRQVLDALAGHLTIPDSLRLLHAEALIRASDVASATMLMDDIASDDPIVQSGLSVLRARAARVAGKNETTVQIAEEELRNARCTSDQEAFLHRYAGLGQLFLGHFESAEAHHLKALERFEASGNLAEASYTRCDLGLTHFFRGVDYVKAERYYRQALKVVRRLHRVDTLAMVLNNLASLLIETARSRDALELLEEARNVVEETGDLFWRADVAHSLGEAYRSLGEGEAALRAFEQSSEFAWEANSEYRAQSACLWRSIVLAECGRDSEIDALVGMVSPNLMSQLRPLEVLVAVRRAWLRRDMEASIKLARKLILVSQDAKKERYVRFGRLFWPPRSLSWRDPISSSLPPFKGWPEMRFKPRMHSLPGRMWERWSWPTSARRQPAWSTIGHGEPCWTVSAQTNGFVQPSPRLLAGPLRLRSSPCSQPWWCGLMASRRPAGVCRPRSRRCCTSYTIRPGGRRWPRR
ncbi:MAG TPA: tetratricopeptide repeat protein [Chloroflexota bacterium]